VVAFAAPAALVELAAVVAFAAPAALVELAANTWIEPVIEAVTTVIRRANTETIPKTFGTIFYLAIRDNGYFNAFMVIPNRNVKRMNPCNN
jgi:hypothetical protein